MDKSEVTQLDFKIPGGGGNMIDPKAYVVERFL